MALTLDELVARTRVIADAYYDGFKALDDKFQADLRAVATEAETAGLDMNVAGCALLPILADLEKRVEAIANSR